jgi:hypothetical protein
MFLATILPGKDQDQLNALVEACKLLFIKFWFKKVILKSFIFIVLALIAAETWWRATHPKKNCKILVPDLFFGHLVIFQEDWIFFFLFLLYIEG